MARTAVAMTEDPGFAPSPAELAAALALLTAPGAQRSMPPERLPEHGFGEAEMLSALAPLIVGGAQRLDATDALAHMDPPTPWPTWVVTFWNAALNQNLLHPDLSPAAGEIEQRVIDWIAPWFGMDGGHMTAGSTLANLTALWAAREIKGAQKVYASSAAHLSVPKAAHLLGMEHLAVPTDPLGRLDASALPADLSDAAIVLTAGATSTGAIDPGITGAAWTHLDAAWAGPLKFSERHRAVLDGFDHADSVAVSAHKWLFQPKESAMILFRDTVRAHEAVSFGGAYLATPNVGVLGSRAAVAAPLLATLWAWGRAGLAERIDRTMDVASEIHARIAAHPELETFGPCETGVFLWRDRRRPVGETYTALPKGLASTTTVNGEDWIRQVAANPMADVGAIWTAIEAAL